MEGGSEASLHQSVFLSQLEVTPGRSADSFPDVTHTLQTAAAPDTVAFNSRSSLIAHIYTLRRVQSACRTHSSTETLEHKINVCQHTRTEENP